MDDRSISFSQMNKMVNMLANGLISKGLHLGDRVGILSLNCLEYPIIDYAVAKCGGVFVPINFRYKKDELSYVINDTKPKFLFYGPEFASIVAEVSTNTNEPLCLIAINGETFDRTSDLNTLMEGHTTSEPKVPVIPSSPSRILYTGGTTGVPKGVLLSHLSYLSFYVGIIVESNIDHNEVTLVDIPLFHNGGLNLVLNPTLMRGGTCVITADSFDPERTLDYVERYSVTQSVWVPTQLSMLVNYQNINNYNLTSLKKIGYGSSPITPAVLNSCLDIFNAGFYQWYGLTETSVVGVLRPEDHYERSQFTGTEMLNAELRIISDDGSDTLVEEIGEIICAQKPLGMNCYYNMEEATKNTIKNGWIHTGDIARVEEGGYFTIIDRISDMIISGAENIYPKEIENAISDHSGVLEVAVFGIPDEQYGESVCAAIVKREGYKFDEKEIIGFCKSRISGYKKPKKILFMEELPKSAAGKVMKNVLKKPFWLKKNREI